MKLPEVKEVEPIEKRFHRVSSAAIDILKVCFFTFCYKMLIIVNNGHFPFNRSSGLKFWKFQWYIPVVQTRPKPLCIWLLFL